MRDEYCTRYLAVQITSVDFTALPAGTGLDTCIDYVTQWQNHIWTVVEITLQ